MLLLGSPGLPLDVAASLALRLLARGFVLACSADGASTDEAFGPVSKLRMGERISARPAGHAAGHNAAQARVMSSEYRRVG